MPSLACFSRIEDADRPKNCVPPLRPANNFSTRNANSRQQRPDTLLLWLIQSSRPGRRLLIFSFVSRSERGTQSTPSSCSLCCEPPHGAGHGRQMAEGQAGYSLEGCPGQCKELSSTPGPTHSIPGAPLVLTTDVPRSHPVSPKGRIIWIENPEFAKTSEKESLFPPAM